MICPGCRWNMSFTEGLRQKFCNRCRELMLHKACAGMANIPLDYSEREQSAKRYRAMEVPEYEPFAHLDERNFTEGWQ